MRLLGLTVGLSLVTTFVEPQAALACGGFFCDSGPTNATVINQNAERIVFVRHEDSVEAYIQIRYEGDPVDFAWIVPVVSRPQLDVADPNLFDALDRATAPQFIFAPPVSSGGGGGGGGGGGFGCSGAASDRSAMAGGDGDGDADADGDDDDVQVWGQDNIGSYETAIITADDSRDLTDWLEANEYTVPPEAGGIIDQYVEEGSFFVAIRLVANADLDLLEPLVIRYAGTEPCVPLRLTQVAAMPDMGVLVWIVGDEQAFPYNYARAIVDDQDVVLDRTTNATNYLDLVSRAVDAAGQGRAFVTEYAQPTSQLPDLSEDAYYYYGSTTGSQQAEDIVNSGQYITRLYTQIDPQEMTLDPIFEFDPDLADVSNIHDFTQASASAAGIVERRTAYASVPLALVFLAGFIAFRRKR